MNLFSTLSLTDNNTVITCNDVDGIRNELIKIKISRFDVVTKVESQVDLFTNAELDEIINNVCSTSSYDYVTDSGALNNIYNNSKSVLLGEIKEDASNESININSYLQSSIFIETGSALTTVDINNFNAYNKLLAILNESNSVYSISNSDTYYMSATNLTNFRKLMNIVKNNYNQYGGSFTNVSDIINTNALGSVNQLYGINTLNTQDSTIFAGIQSEVKDLKGENNLLNLYQEAIFFDKLEEEVILHLTTKFFTFDSKSLLDYKDDVEGKMLSYSSISDDLIASHNLSHDNNLSKLLDDSTIIINNYQTSNEMNTLVIETGNINLSSYEVVNTNLGLVKEENGEIMTFFGEVRENNNSINQVNADNETSFLESLGTLETANEEQAEFITQYEDVLSVASKNGVSNTEFYDFVTNPIEFEKNDVGENVTTLGAYFIILWLFTGLFIINILKDKFSQYFKLDLSNNSFKESKLINIIENNLIYLIMLILFALAFTITLISKFDISSKVVFAVEFIVIALLINYIMRFIFTRLKFKGYMLTLLCILLIFTLMFTANNSILIKIIASPFTALENFIMVHIYNISYNNAYLYTFMIYASITIVLAAVNILYYLKNNKRVGI